MPKSPILSREVFYDKRRDGSFVHLDFCLVNTSLGAMIESRNVSLVTSPFVQLDLDDISFNRLVPMDETTFYSTFNIGGTQLPADANTQ